MMAQHEKMMADMGAMDAKLDHLVAGMNASQGTTKTNATAAVVTELVAQRKQMRERMMSMQSEMGGHMIGAHAGGQGLDGYVPYDEADRRYEALSGGHWEPRSRRQRNADQRPGHRMARSEALI